MLNRERIREKGTIGLSKIFRAYKPGDNIVLMHNLSFPRAFHQRLQGKTGIIKGKRGRAYIVELKDIRKTKTYIINQVHLKKIK